MSVKILFLFCWFLYFNLSGRIFMFMKLGFRAFVLLFMVLVLFSAPAGALEPKTHMFTLGPDVSYYHFSETGIDEDAILYGLAGNYTYRGKLLTESLPSGVAKIDGRIIFGRVDFNGYLYDGNYYNIKQVKDYLVEFRGLVGYDFPIFSNTTITPFTGVGSRLLTDQLQKNDAGYRRDSNYLYSPIGFETKTPLKNGWSLGVNAEYDIFWHGWQDTYLSDLDPLFSDLTNDQTQGYGIKFSVKIRKEVLDKNFIFEPYVDYWNIESSDTQKVYHTGVYANRDFQEPANESTIAGMKVAVEF